MTKKLMNKLLTRDAFRELALKRDGGCVFCGDKKAVVHHIMDRKLFVDGGYYLDNAASVCDDHHWDCEKTDISVEDVRTATGITTIFLPDGFDANKSYDKWGNIILHNGRRQPGPMFFEENVQKILKDKLYLFDV